MITLYLVDQFERNSDPRLGWYAVAFNEHNLDDRYLIFLNAVIDPVGNAFPVFSAWHVFKNGVLLNNTELEQYVISLDYFFYHNQKGEIKLCK